MKTTLEQQIAQAETLLDVLLILKQVTMLDTHVATLAYLESCIQEYDENKKYGIWSCKPFPLDTNQKEYRIQAYYFTQDGNNLNKDQIVVILFMDRNFINNLQSAFVKPMVTNDEILHSLKYGVIVNPNLTDLQLSESEKEEILDL